MNAAEKFGYRVRAVRKAHKLKIGQLAEKAGTSAKYLGRLERGEKQPSFELIVALAQALGVSPARFFEFDLVESDPRALQRELVHLLADAEVSQLQRVYRTVKALLEV
jgi:transcriptional regulator with XRE-family HTH domain